MNGRLVLLIVAAAIFVRLWMPMKPASVRMSALQARQSTGERARQPVSAFRPATEAARFTAAKLPIAEGPGMVGHGMAQAADATTIEHWTVTSAPIALPPDLEPGKYRVIDQTGRVALLEVRCSGEDFGCRPTRSGSPEFFVIRNDSTSWYFVRLTSAADVALTASAAGESPAQNDVVPDYSTPEPVLGNRKFDFSGYAEETETTDSTASQKSSTIEQTPTDTTAAPHHAALRLALLQRDAERAVRDIAERVTGWWKRTSITLRHAEVTPILPSL